MIKRHINSLKVLIMIQSLIICIRVTLSLDYETIGCYRDTWNRAITVVEGKDPILDGSYHSRTNAIAKCAVAALRKGYTMFAVQNGGHCQTSATAAQTFDKYGKSTACKADGEGGWWANQVYVIKESLKGKCYNT